MTDQTNKPQDNNAERRHPLGIAGGMAKEFIHSPLSVLLLLASLAIGIMGLLFTPRQEDPQISVPMVDVFFSYPGASAEQVSSLAIDPLVVDIDVVFIDDRAHFITNVTLGIQGCKNLVVVRPVCFAQQWQK